MNARATRTAARGRVLAVVAVVVALSFVGAACGSSDEAAPRITATTRTADPLIAGNDPIDKLEALDDPARYGLPPIETLQTNPGGVAVALLQRFATTTWTMTWALASPNNPDAKAGEIVIAHLPADGSQNRPEQLMVNGQLGAASARSYEFAILDRADTGPRTCFRESETQAWVCDVPDIDLALKFLSLEGFRTIQNQLREALIYPGLNVQYALVAGAPSACFFFPPLPEFGAQTNPADLGVDFKSGGQFCLSVDGALTRVVIGSLKFTAIEYRQSADPSKFKLPVESATLNTTTTAPGATGGTDGGGGGADDSDGVGVNPFAPRN